MNDLHKPGRKLAVTVTEKRHVPRYSRDNNSTCGQSISAGGSVWNVMQRLGERISEEEEHAVKQMHADQSEEKRRFQYCLKKWMAYSCHAGMNSIKDEKQKSEVFTM